MSRRQQQPGRPAGFLGGDDRRLSAQPRGRRPTSGDARSAPRLPQQARPGIGWSPEQVTAERLFDRCGPQGHWSLETRPGYRSAARKFFAWAFKTGRVTSDLSDALPAVRQIVPPPRPAPDDVWRRALDAADAGTRLMMRLAAEAGMRRGEVACVHTRDVLDGIDGARLVVHGKGGRGRVVPISDSLADAIRAGAAGHTPGAPASGYLFPRWRADEHVSAQYVGELVAAALPEQWTMHCLRHRYATRAYPRHRNLRAVQVLLGHASIVTTERYTAVDDDEIRAAMM